MSDEHPEIVRMTAKLANRLGLPLIPFVDDKPVARAEDVPSILVLATSVFEGNAWRYWDIDPGLTNT